MANAPQHPAPPAQPPSKPAPPPLEEDAFPPQKFKRPLAQPGDKDYVTGQPTTDEEADRIEKEEADKHAAAKAAREKAQAAAKAATEKAAKPHG
jgi:hypothetical protein